jgi:hypothetical protein
VQSELQNRQFSALRESQIRYVFSGENAIEKGRGGQVSSVAASHSLTLQTAEKTRFSWSHQSSG